MVSYLTGGGALLKNLDKVISDETNMPVFIAENPLDCVAIGTGMALDHIELCVVIKQNKGRRRDARARSGRAALHVRADARVLRDRGRCARPHPSRPRDHRVVEGEAARRPDRREPERRGEDDRVGLLRAAAPGRPRLDAPALGGGRRVARRAAVHDGRRARARSPPRRPLRGRPQDEATSRACPPRPPLTVCSGHLSVSATETGLVSTGARPG